MPLVIHPLESVNCLLQHFRGVGRQVPYDSRKVQISITPVHGRCISNPEIHRIPTFVIRNNTRIWQFEIPANYINP